MSTAQGYRPSSNSPSKSAATGTPAPTWFKAVIALVVTGALVAALVAWLRPKPAQAACVVAVDVRGSSRIMLNQYREWLPRILDSCALAKRADVTVLPVTSQTQTGATTAVATKLSETPDMTGDQTNDDGRVKGELSRFATQDVPAVFNTPAQAGGGTDLLGAGTVALPYVQDAAPGSSIVFLTDGVHNQDPYRLLNIPLDQASIDKYIAELGDAGRIPDLTEVNVYMYGVNVGRSTTVATSEQLDGIQRFWRSYWAATGATLVKYQKQP